jgi:hypothetical protein
MLMFNNKHLEFFDLFDPTVICEELENIEEIFIGNFLCADLHNKIVDGDIICEHIKLLETLNMKTACSKELTKVIFIVILDVH